MVRFIRSVASETAFRHRWRRTDKNRRLIDTLGKTWMRVLCPSHSGSTDRQSPACMWQRYQLPRHSRLRQAISTLSRFST
jgi:hypothetical protein